jgi:general stress protein CsbA
MLPLFNISIVNFLKRIILKPVISTLLLAVIFFAVVTRNLYVGIAILAIYMVFSTLTMIDENDRREFVKVFQ